MQRRAERNEAARSTRRPPRGTHQTNDATYNNDTNGDVGRRVICSPNPRGIIQFGRASLAVCVLSFGMVDLCGSRRCRVRLSSVESWFDLGVKTN